MGQLELSVGSLGNKIRLMGVATIFLVGGGFDLNGSPNKAFN